MPNLFDKQHLNIVISSFPIFFILSIMIPALLLYTFNGAEDFNNLLKFIFYVGMLLFALIVIAVEQLTNDRDVGVWFKTYLFNPEMGLLNGFNLFRNPIKLIMISWILVGFLGSVSIISNTFFIKMPTYQILPIASIGLSAEPAASAETLMFFGVLQGLFYGLAKLISKKNKAVFIALIILGVILTGTVAFPAYHMLRYGSDEQSILGVAFFGTGNAILTSITGSVIPALMWHEVNNGLNEAKTLFSKDVVLVVWSIIWFTTSAIFAWIILNWKEKKNKRFI